MHWSYNGYSFDENAVSFEKTGPALLDSGGVPYAYNVQYKLRGDVRITDQGSAAANQAAMTTKLLALEAALSVNFGDLILYDDNNLPTVHRLINSETLGGVKVLTAVEYPTSFGAEYSTYRTFQVTVGCQVAAPASASNGSVIDWTESLTFVGTGGERKVWHEYLEGDPDYDVTAQRTTVKAIQAGSARGFADYLAFPAPLFGPDKEHLDQRIYKRDTPSYMAAGTLRYFPTSWQYFFEFAASSGVTANPTPRPINA